MVRVIFCLIALIFSQTTWALSSISSTVDKNPVVVNESFVLDVIADDSVDANALDTSPLMKDFIVGRTSVSSQTSMVNFKTTRTTRFQTVLIARKSGTIIIPALTIEGKKTQAISLTVLAKNDARSEQQKDLFITSDISATEVYVQQQLTLTVKLHFAAELKRGSLSDPILVNANIKQIGQDKEQDVILNGRRFRVIERTYSISPQQSGEYKLQSPVFSGEVMMPSARRSNFLSFGETKPVSVMGDEISLTVKPIPDNYQGAWLPSELLTMHQEWQPDMTSFKVGEPITRTITLTAAGLSEEQLPEISMPMSNGLKIYPDQANLHTGMNSNTVVSQKVRNFAIVASRAGKYTLPEIKIPWWNTVTNRFQVATIPAQKITVQENPDLELDQQTQLINSTNQNNLHKPITITVVEHSKLQWLFLTLWLLTMLAWIISARFNKNKTTNFSNEKIKANNNSGSTNYLKLLAACKTNDGQSVLQQIVPWVNILVESGNTNEIATLDEACTVLKNQAFTNEVRALQQCYFGKNAQTWQGEILLQLIQAINNNPNKFKPSEEFSLTP